MSWRPTKRWVAGALVATMIGVVVWEQVQAYRETRDRYDEIDTRIEAAMPKDRGIQAVPQDWAPPADLMLVITTSPSSERVSASITIQIEKGRAWTLPVPAAGASEAALDEWWLEDVEPVVEQIQAILAQLITRRGVDVATISTPRVAGGLRVPPALVVRLLAVLNDLGVSDVAFRSDLPPPGD